MNSQELISGSKERFNELQEEREDFDKDLIDYLKFLENQGILMIKDEEKLVEKLVYFLQTTKSYHWKSFYHGWLESKALLDEK